MNIHLYYYAVECAGIACAVILIVGVLRSNPYHKNAWIFVLLLLCMICFFIRTRQEYSPWMPEVFKLSEGMLVLPMEVLMNAFSGLFMIFAFSMFRENQKFPRWLLALFAFQLSLEPITILFTREELQIVDAILGVAISDFFFYKLMRILQLVFVSAVVYWTVIDWRADLVEGRRRLRWIFIGYEGVFNIFAGLAYTFLVPQDEFIGYQVHVAIITASTVTAFLLIWFNFSVDSVLFSGPLLGESTPEQSPEHQYPEMEHDWQKYNECFELGHIYREPGLSIGSLADRLSIPEYRLRKLIHERLGYRNFNVLLHNYRIKEVCEALSDPNRSHVPILTIALSAGYQSINPFNRAFRELKNMTPSEFRKRVERS